MMYEILFWVGLIGMAAQALLGMGGHGHAAPHHHAGSGHHAGHNQAAGSHGHFSDMFLSLLSPLTAFSICLGIGAAGLLLRSLELVSPERLGLAVLSGAVFYGAIVHPLRALIFKFASDPAKSLEGTVAGTAVALSHFDRAGKGLVRLTIDDQLVRILAFLEIDDRADAASIQPGDTLTVVSVDGHANTCRVTRL